MKKGISNKIFIIILFVCILAISASVYFMLFYNKDKENIDTNTVIPTSNDIENKQEEEEIIIKEKKELNIFNGTDRLIAVMIDNEKPAWPHSGLQDAYIIYEAIIEGGESRQMALFKGTNTEKIGPIRSSRHYFVHYAMEHNAVYCHFGWSPIAEETIKNYGVNNINGLYDEYYWRVGYGYHNAFSSIENIKNYMNKKEYLDISKSEPLYNYSFDEYNLEQGKKVKSLYITYSSLHNVSYKYDTENKVFLRSMRNEIDVDRETNKQYYAKNIVIMYANNYSLNDGSGKGRQELENIGSGTGHYLTNGNKIDITWEKDSIKDKTYFYDENNEEIILNDGLTYIQIVPINNEVEFEYDIPVAIEQDTETSIETEE